jgi:hypothetical protein
MNISRLLIVAVHLIGFASLAPGASGKAAGPLTDDVRCPESNFIVEAPVAQPAMPALEICRFIADALDRLSGYGLTVNRPLRIKVLERADRSCDVRLLGQFNLKEFHIQIISFDRCLKEISGHKVLAGISPKEWYKSIICHEIAHAAFATFAEMQNVPIARPIAQEYLAYAIQLRVLSAESRRVILEAFPRKTPTDLGGFNSTYLALNPLAFATNAYRHLFSRNNTRGHVARVLRGEIAFPKAQVFYY